MNSFYERQHIKFRYGPLGGCPGKNFSILPNLHNSYWWFGREFVLLSPWNDGRSHLFGTEMKEHGRSEEVS